MIYNLCDIGISMLAEIIHSKNPPQVGRGYTDPEKEQFREYHDKFGFTVGDDCCFIAAVAFLKVLQEYIELDIYK